MKRSDPRDAVPLALIVASIAIVLLITSASRWAHSILLIAGRPATVILAVALLTFALLLLAARLVVTRRTLNERVVTFALPADSFDPSIESVLRFASGLSRSRRAIRGLLDAPASAVRLGLDADPEGRLRYRVEVPDRASAALRAALGAYSGVELRRDEGERASEPPEGAALARAELILARPSSEPLRAVGLDPDPLSGFARAINALDPAGGDAANVCVDLLPVSAGKRRRLRRRLLRRRPRGATRGPRRERRPRRASDRSRGRSWRRRPARGARRATGRAAVAVAEVGQPRTAV